MATWRQLDAAMRLRSGLGSLDYYGYVDAVDGGWWQITIGCCRCSGHLVIATYVTALDCSPCVPVGPSLQGDSRDWRTRFQRPF